jgi:hypothetical protein
MRFQSAARRVSHSFKYSNPSEVLKRRENPSEILAKCDAPKTSGNNRLGPERKIGFALERLAASGLDFGENVKDIRLSRECIIRKSVIICDLHLVIEMPHSGC